MQVSDLNNVKIYNLSAGKSLPEWLSERKRRTLLKKDVDIRRRIELIQDFDMPGLSTSIRVSKDGQYILATGIYKPRVKCFDVNNLSLKFERCFDSECVTFEILSDDYSKIVFLQCDRYVEFHVAHGRYYRLRIPKFGRDMKYHYPSCDLYIVGSASDIYRLNLERGQFLTPYSSESSAINRCEINPVHHLLICGTQEGRIEAWDTRSKSLVGNFDCALNFVNDLNQLQSFPSITALKFNGALQLGVGTATGHVLLYDIRSNKPFYIKDHMNELPIKDVEFHKQEEFVYSMDGSTVKIWDKNNGKLYTSIEAKSEFNNLCIVPNTGLLFIANENTKMQTFYIPSLGPAPKWASFLDNLTEELEESNTETVYDDYKFVTKTELENLGLDHLIGTNLLRAYMHGYFIDVRLYKKARDVANPFEFDQYRKQKIRQVIENDREARVKVDKLPKVNKDLALKLINDKITNKKKNNSSSLLTDNRFKALFDNPEFEIDKNAEEYRFLNPVLSRLDKNKKKELKQKLVGEEFETVQEEDKDQKSSDDDFESDDSSDDDDGAWKEEMKKQHKILEREKRIREKREEIDKLNEEQKAPKFFELRAGEEFKGAHNMKRKLNKASLAERLQNEDSSVKMHSFGNRQMTFSVSSKAREAAINEKNKRHREERKKLVRPTFGIKSSKKKHF
ncbi:nucleolar protein 10 [Onthophagus taurus]|uniref:nucleolar protein 10 n=1 Tax=Onthophagus taurus TaxID=166361 RepID=UPI0039BE1207